jgi:hypothetical protein
MQPRLVIEFLRMFLGEKQPGTVDFNAPLTILHHIA